MLRGRQAVLPAGELPVHRAKFYTTRKYTICIIIESSLSDDDVFHAAEPVARRGLDSPLVSRISPAHSLLALPYPTEG